MFRTKLTLAVVIVVAALTASIPAAFAAHDPWYGYAVSLTQARQSTPFITDTLAPGGNASTGGHDPWYGYAVSLSQAQSSPRFITDTLAPGGGPNQVVSPASNGFDWADAGIGAGVTGAIALLLLGSGVALQHRRKVVTV